MIHKIIQLIDKEALTAPTSKMVKREEYKKLRPNEMSRQLAFIFKPRKPLNIEEDLAKFLIEKYNGVLEVVGKVEKPQSILSQFETVEVKPEDVKKDIIAEMKQKGITEIKKFSVTELRRIALKLGVTNTGKKATLIVKVKKAMGI